MTPSLRPRLGPIQAPILFLVGGGSMYLGAALAVDLFALLSPPVVAWLRLLGAALVLLVWRRPGRDAWRGHRLPVAAGRVAAAGNGADDLAVGFAAAAVLLAPLAAGAGPVWREPRLLGLGIGVGVLSSVLPYVLDQIVLRGVGRARFAVPQPLLPVTASVIGLLVLGQHPGVLEVGAIGAVVAAVALRTRVGGEPVPP